MRLLDVNVLIALADADHSDHRTAWKWFAERARDGWATCPLTENAFLRILSHPAYPRFQGLPSEVMPILRALQLSAGHIFWADDISLADSALFPTSLSGVSSKQLTDIYLLGLAKKHNAIFATFDRRISTSSVSNGHEALEIIS